MKKLFYYLKCASVAILAFSCEKSVVEEPGIKVFADANVESVKISLNSTNYSFAWNKGDRFLIVQAVKEGDPAGYGIMEAQNDGSSSFSGTMNQYVDGREIWAFSPYSENLNPHWTTNVYPTVAIQQTGKLEDFGSYYQSYGKFTDVAYSVEDGLSGTVSLKSFTPVLKFSLSADFGVKKIVVTGKDENEETVNLAGACKLKLKKDKDAEFIVNVGDSQNITIYRNGETVSGDIYVCFCSNKVDNKVNINNANTLSFKFFNQENNTVTKNITLNTNLVAGYVKELGPVASLVFPLINNSSLKFVDQKVVSDKTGSREAVPIISVENYPSGCTCYYTIGDEESVADPTDDSSSFDPSKGFTYSTVSDLANIKKYIKVLVRCEGYQDKILRAYVREWPQSYGSTTQVGYAKLTPPGNEKSVKVDDLEIYNNKGGENYIFNCGEKKSYVEMRKCAFGISATRNCDGYFYIIANCGNKGTGYALKKGDTTIEPGLNIGETTGNVGAGHCVGSIKQDDQYRLVAAGGTMRAFTVAFMEMY